MSWLVEENPQHEGYAAHVARDGRCATASTAAGLVMSSSQVGGEWVDEVLPWSELIGWEARCECGWVGPMYRRDGDEQEPAEHPLLGSRFPDAEEAIHAAWRMHAPEDRVMPTHRWIQVEAGGPLASRVDALRPGEAVLLRGVWTLREGLPSGHLVAYEIGDGRDQE